MVGIINALPMSLIQDVTVLIPNKDTVTEVLDREASVEDEVAWLWGHANSDAMAVELATKELHLKAEIRKDFGPRPTIFAHAYGGFIAIDENCEQVHLDKLIVLAPTFASAKRKAEGEVATAAEITGFRPILVKN